MRGACRWSGGVGLAAAVFAGACGRMGFDPTGSHSHGGDDAGPEESEAGWPPLMVASELYLGAGSTPKIAASGERFGIAWQAGGVGPTTFTVYAPTGDVISGPRTLGPSGSAVGVIGLSDGFVVGYSRYTGVEYEAWLLRLDADGAITAEQRIRTSASHTLFDLTRDGETLCVTEYAGADAMNVSRFDLAGVPSGPTHVIPVTGSFRTMHAMCAGDATYALRTEYVPSRYVTHYHAISETGAVTETEVSSPALGEVYVVGAALVGTTHIAALYHMSGSAAEGGTRLAPMALAMPGTLDAEPLRPAMGGGVVRRSGERFLLGWQELQAGQVVRYYSSARSDYRLTGSPVSLVTGSDQDDKRPADIARTDGGAVAVTMGGLDVNYDNQAYVTFLVPQL